MKMPEPMMPPMTTIVASKGPSARRKSRADYTRVPAPAFAPWLPWPMSSDFTPLHGVGEDTRQRRGSTSPAATSSAARSTISRARATRWLLPDDNDNGYRRWSRRSRAATASIPRRSRRHRRRGRELPGVRRAPRAWRRRADRAARLRSAARRGAHCSVRARSGSSGRSTMSYAARSRAGFARR